MNDTINVAVSMDFSDAILAQFRAVSPRLRVERYFPNVPDQIWPEVEVLYTPRKLPDPVAVPRLRWVQLHTAGVDHLLNEPLFKAEDVEFTSANGIHATPMAEYCIGMMIAAQYKFWMLPQFQAKAEWPVRQHTIFNPNPLRGSTLGIAGYGAVGRELARVAEAMGMTVLAAKRDAMRPADHMLYAEAGTGDPEGSIPARIYPAEALASMAAECDYLVLLFPLTPFTRKLVDENVLKAMKKTAYLINVARGGIVDEAALISALAAKTIAGAALDVFDEEPLPSTSPLWNLDNVIITPHISGNSATYHERVGALFAENLRRYVEKRDLLNRVDRKYGY